MAVIKVDFNHIKEKLNIDKSKFEETITWLGIPIEDKEDNIYHLEITPNRPDLLSSEGLIRQLNQFFTLSSKQYKAQEKIGSAILDENIKGVREFVSFAYIKNISLDDDKIAELMQLQEKIHDTLGRKRKKAAVGIHDASKIKFPLSVFSVDINSDQKFIPLAKTQEMTIKQILNEHEKGIKYKHLVDSRALLIKDANNQILSFPPIINSNLTAVNVSTTDILIDVTGTNKQTVEKICAIFSCMFEDMGGTIFSIEIQDNLHNTKEIHPILKNQTLPIDYNFIKKILGQEFEDEEINNYLRKMGHSVKDNIAYVPPYRTDVLGNIDLAEDVAIAFGYNNFDATLPKISTIGKLNNDYTELKQILIGMGFFETISYHLTNPNTMKDLGLTSGFLELSNPLTTDFTMFRPTLIHSILRIFSENQNKKLPQKIFEIGDTIRNNEIYTDLCIGIADSKLDYTQIKSVFDALNKEYFDNLKLAKTENQLFIPGRCAAIILNNKQIGQMGEINPKILDSFGLKVPVVLLNLELEKTKTLDFIDN